MRTKLTVVLSLVALALIWALSQIPDDETLLEPPTPVTVDAAGASDVIELVEAGTEAPLARREVTDGVEGGPASPVPPVALIPAPPASLDVLVVDKETGAPIPGAGLMVYSGEGKFRTSAEWIGGKGRRSPTSDGQGRARFLLTPDTSFRVRASNRANGASTARVLEPIASGETYAVRLELATQPDARFVGRVVEAESGKPISGAVVRFLTGSPRRPTGASSTSSGTGDEFRTGFEGWFEAPLETWVRQCGWVEAEGFGPRVFQLDASHGIRERALVVRLQQGATLRGHIRGAPDLAGLLVHVEARGYELAESTVMSSSLRDLHRQASVAEDGTWVLNNLPPMVGLRVELRRGETLVRTEPERQFLQPGEERSLDWPLGGGSAIHGRAVIAETDEPLASRSIWLVPWNKVRGLLSTYHKPVARTTTDDEGYFEFSDVPPGEWAVGPEPPGRSSEDDEVAPMATMVSIEDGVRSVTVELRLYRGLFISGEVLGLDGQRVESGTVYGYGQESRIQSTADANAGTFRIGPLVPGSYRLTARGGGPGTSRSERLTAMAGDEDVVLQVNAGGTVEGRLVNAATGEPVMGWIQVSDEAAMSRTVSTQSKPDGSFSFRSLRFGTYSAAGTSGDLAGIIGGVVVGPSQAARDLEVPLEPGAALRITYTGEQAYVDVRGTSEKLLRRLGGYERGSSARTIWTPGEVVVSISYKSADGETHTVERTVNMVVGEETVVEIGDE